MPNKLLRPLIIFLGLLILFNLFGGKNQNQNQDDIVLESKSKISLNKEVRVTVKNNSNFSIILPENCPKNPLMVEQYLNGEWLLKEASVEDIQCEGHGEITLEPGQAHIIPFQNWSWELFNEVGRYRVTLNSTLGGKEKTYSQEINIVQQGLLRTIGLEAFYKPILNTLIFLISVIPGFSLGWGVILLTLIIKLILLAPNHKALKAQKQMQRVQPELEALKLRHKDNPQKLAEETMKIWKKYKVNPMSSCTPMLIQFPILIALFYVVRGGLSFTNPALLYGALKNFDLHQVQHVFLGLMDLTQANMIVLPLIVGGLQYYQMHLTLGKIKTDPGAQPNPTAMMNKMMKYMMPVLIAVFTATMPAAVGLYWGTSTLFGIAQQVFINRSKD